MAPRPVSVTIFGILNIGFAVFGFGTLVLIWIITKFVTLPANNPIMAFAHDPAYLAWMKVQMIMGLLSNPLMLAAGIGLLLLKNWGRIGSIVYAIYAIIWAFVSSYVTSVVIRPAMHQGLDRLGPMGAVFSIVGAVFTLAVSLAYPVL